MRIIYVCTKLDVQREALKGKWLPKIVAKNDSPPPRTLKAVILVYTAFFSQINWVKKKDWCSSGQYNKEQCSLGHIELTYNKSRFYDGDIVVFHARIMPRLEWISAVA